MKERQRHGCGIIIWITQNIDQVYSVITLGTISKLVGNVPTDSPSMVAFTFLLTEATETLVT
jgi:hypothetical protein